jgi:TRAP-type mannitol/chloroaromatic compound transport system substrate-binding protein
MKTSRLGLVVAAVAGVAFGATAAQAQTVLRTQLGQNAGDFVYRFLTEQWMRKLKAMTGGKVVFEPHPANAIVPSREVPDSVADGVLQADLVSPIFYSGKDPVYGLIGDLTSAYESPDQSAAWCAHGGGKELLQKAHDKYTGGRVKVVGCAPYTQEALVAKKPIRGLAELKGMKVRAPEGLAAEVFRRAGAAPVSLPFSEVYSALEKGVVDAADASAYSNNASQGYNVIAPYPLFPGFHSVAIYEFAINKAVWDKLDPGSQAALEVWHHAAYNDLRRVSHIEDMKIVSQDKKPGSKVEVIDWPQKDRDALRAIAAEAWKSFAEKSPLAQEAYASQMAFLKLLGLLK